MNIHLSSPLHYEKEIPIPQKEKTPYDRVFFLKTYRRHLGTLGW